MGRPPLLNQARILLRQVNPDEAVKLYKQLFNGRAPQETLAWSTTLPWGIQQMAGQKRWQDLTRARSPNDPQIQLALANLRVLRDGTRMQGLRALVTLSRRPDIGGVATEQWRQVLTWLGAPPPPSTSQYFEEYLKANPDDDEIRQQYRAGCHGIDEHGIECQARARARRSVRWTCQDRI